MNTSEFLFIIYIEYMALLIVLIFWMERVMHTTEECAFYVDVGGKDLCCLD